MATPVQLRVCGIEFNKVEVKKVPLAHAYKYDLEVVDRVYGPFTVTSEMLVEMRDQGRWKRISLGSFINQLLVAREVYE
jgi:hypothetical protein